MGGKRGKSICHMLPKIEKAIVCRLKKWTKKESV